MLIAGEALAGSSRVLGLPTVRAGCRWPSQGWEGGMMLPGKCCMLDGVWMRVRLDDCPDRLAG